MTEDLSKKAFKSSYGNLGFGEGVEPIELLKELDKLSEEADKGLAVLRFGLATRESNVTKGLINHIEGTVLPNNFRNFTKLFQMGVLGEKGTETNQILGLIKDNTAADFSKPPTQIICFKENVSVPPWGLLCCLYPFHHLSFSLMEVVDQIPEGSVPAFLLGYRHGDKVECSNVLTAFTDGPPPIADSDGNFEWNCTKILVSRSNAFFSDYYGCNTEFRRKVLENILWDDDEAIYDSDLIMETQDSTFPAIPSSVGRKEVALALACTAVKATDEVYIKNSLSISFLSMTNIFPQIKEFFLLLKNLAPEGKCSLLPKREARMSKIA
eukprot:GHVP01003383.1.p1 GENE.GHVP01003383.1~~GHVP01003383.1.p1  ORF type:complete len:325 (-),score=52.10 GHVP01003383.1:1649-2623(-)